MRKPFVTAHAGALGTEPNTLDSVRAALSCGADILEVDVRFLPDGTPALGHNSVDARSARLEDVFALMQSCAIHINLDMKETAHVPRMAELAAQYGLRGRAFMTGLFEAGCAALRDCGLPYYLNAADPAAAAGLGALGVNVNYRQCAQTLARDAHARGLLVSVWTVDSPGAMRRMLRWGADNITTHRPDALLEIINHDV
ncbi:MAG: glycerophosphodiester phosphodiesterase [Oscillospiraceae bacterium]|jgi:glycerophosphoryl diester phosphodiesterase|nr:glycerophosphodiester phosphodiesterase [Oscillospiraceae bacterium]